MVNTRDKFEPAADVTLSAGQVHPHQAEAEGAIAPAESVAEQVGPVAAAEGVIALGKKEAEDLRAANTERAARLYLAERRSGNDKASVRDCCDLVAREEAAVAGALGRPVLRPAETSVRRLLPRYMTDAEKEDKRAAEARGDVRAAATRRAAEAYRAANGDGDGDVVLSVTRCCAAALAACGIRPAETSVRRLLGRMYKEEGLTPRKRKARPPPRPPRPAPAGRHAPPAPPGGIVPGEQPLVAPGGFVPGEQPLVAPGGFVPGEQPLVRPDQFASQADLHDPSGDEGLLLPPPLPDPEIDVVAV